MTTSNLKTRFVLKIVSKTPGVEEYLLNISNGLVLVTKNIEGRPTFDGKGRCGVAKTFTSKKEAGDYVAAYLRTRLPAGKAHSEFEIVEVL